MNLAKVRLNLKFKDYEFINHPNVSFQMLVLLKNFKKIIFIIGQAQEKSSRVTAFPRSMIKYAPILTFDYRKTKKNKKKKHFLNY